MVTRYIMILSTIDAMNRFTRQRATGNAIASNIQSISRSTVYRTLAKMETLGLVYVEVYADGNEHVITAHGFDFLQSQLELPF